RTSPRPWLRHAAGSPAQCWWQIWSDTGGWSGENAPSPDHRAPAPRPAVPVRQANVVSPGRASSRPLPVRHQDQSASSSRWCPRYPGVVGRLGVCTLALGDLVVFDLLELAVDINAVEPGNIAPDDLLFDFIRQIDAVLLLDVFW